MHHYLVKLENYSPKWMGESRFISHVEALPRAFRLEATIESTHTSSIVVSMEHLL